ncbi:S1 family peptidase [Glycomyces sp. L485]|uniref:S1 family peptidase n=1 Tax=Glycomyces sp. L485 TaxID=2909235 RepID=UPI001F4A1E0F|nr:S1 family peptidase [Glycomyces sp. L485]MCH7229819.1 S1 family peptidase [Glycomyces sp. L485]
MRRISASITAIAALTLTQFATGPAGAQEPKDDAEPTHQTEREALQEDLALTAKPRGWTLEEAEQQYRNAEIVGKLAEELAASQPDAFIGSELPDNPADPPILYLKGESPGWVASDAEDLGIRIVDGQPYSFLELEEREIAVHRALSEQGIDQIASGFDLDGGGRIDVTVYDAYAPAADVLLTALPTELADDVELSVADEPIADDLHAFGGARVRDDGVNECTSGWTVVNGSGTTGVTTAGHCDGINQIVEQGVGVWALSHQSQHRGQWGDVEWKTSTHLEPAEFYASSGTLRDTTALEARANISVNESICVYGRSSNSRDCSLDVNDVSVSCTVSGVFNNRLVQMDGRVVIGGDSGGGWSFGNRAYGSTKGYCGGLDVFSVADLYDEAIGVTVRTQ